jgi:hypothetical protein
MNKITSVNSVDKCLLPDIKSPAKGETLNGTSCAEDVNPEATHPTRPGRGLSDWGTRGRKLRDGPIWGHHCGGKWISTREPTDSLDRACHSHDRCWEDCEELPERDGMEPCKDACDDSFVKDLEELPRDPQAWPEPPSQDTEKAAGRFLKRAILWFKWF